MLIYYACTLYVKYTMSTLPYKDFLTYKHISIYIYIYMYYVLYYFYLIYHILQQLVDDHSVISAN